jgi:hypothetical protein
VEAIPQVLDWGVLGLLAVALFAVVQGYWIPKIQHDRLVEQIKAGYDELIDHYKAQDEAKTQEIVRLQARNEEFVQLAMNGTLITSKTLDALKLAWSKGGNSSSETEHQRRD